MNKFVNSLVALVVVAALAGAVSGCSDDKTIRGKTYKTYGLLDRDELRDPCIEYKVVSGNLIWGIILVETIFAPVWFFGFDLWEPVGEKHPGCLAQRRQQPHPE